MTPMIFPTDLSGLDMEGSNFLQQWQMNCPTDHELNILHQLQSELGQDIQQLPQLYNNNHSSVIDFSAPTKQIKPRNCVFPENANAVVGSGLNHGVTMFEPKQENFLVLNSESSSAEQREVLRGKRNGNRSASQARDHIIAERKRREKLSQRFIALSALVPGLKKMDKASVLGDTIKYLKHLQERVRFLEEQASKKTMESVVFVNKSRFSGATDGDEFPATDEPLPEIEARFSGRNVLIRIHCEKRKGIVETTVAEIEKLRLAVINSSIMTFGSNALDVTIIAQMDLEFNMTVKDVVKNLRSTLETFMKA